MNSMLEEIFEKCPNTKKILLREAGIPEKDVEIQSIIVEKEYPFMVEIWYKMENIQGEELYLKKNVIGAVYDAFVEELLKCKHIDKKTKEELKKEKEELEKAWDEYISDP